MYPSVWSSLGFVARKCKTEEGAWKEQERRRDATTERDAAFGTFRHVMEVGRSARLVERWSAPVVTELLLRMFRHSHSVLERANAYRTLWETDCAKELQLQERIVTGARSVQKKYNQILQNLFDIADRAPHFRVADGAVFEWSNEVGELSLN